MHTAYQYFKGLFEGCDKTILAYQSWRPTFCEKVIVIVHGLGEHSGRYIPLIEAMSQKSIGFYAYDQRGHGRSRGLKGHTPSFNHLADDLGKFLKLISVHEQNRPIFLFGHSLGGLVCLKYLVNLHRKGGVIPTGVMLSNPILNLALPVPQWKIVASRSFAKLMPRIRFHNEVSLAELSHDPKVGEAYMTDPLTHQKISAGMYCDMIKTMKDVQDEAGLVSSAMLFMVGSEDRIIDPKKTEEFYSNLNCDNKKLIVYPEYRHELIHEIGKEKVFSDMESWLDQFEAKFQVLPRSGHEGSHP